MTSREVPLALAALLALAPAWAQAQERPQGGSPLRRIPRIGLELALGAAAGAGMAYGGTLLGCSLSAGPRCAPLGAVAGLTLGVQLGVMLGGAMLDGDGGALPTFLATGLGVASMIGGFAFLGPAAAPVPGYWLALLALPVVFGVAGYELTSHDSRAAAQAEARPRRASLTILPAPTREGLGVVVRYAE